MEDIIRKPDGTVVYMSETDIFLQEGIDFYFKKIHEDNKKESLKEARE